RRTVTDLVDGAVWTIAWHDDLLVHDLTDLARLTPANPAPPSELYSLFFWGGRAAWSSFQVVGGVRGGGRAVPVVGGCVLVGMQSWWSPGCVLVGVRW
uniref:hypothetical protein n=1 Tax=Nocardia wallacei TaxID=480035 RepID=UPI002456D9F7